MRMLDELEVTLKDFVPKNGGKLISLGNGGEAVISDGLYNKLQGYARQHAMPLGKAFEQLRNEIHEDA